MGAESSERNVVRVVELVELGTSQRGADAVIHSAALDAWAARVLGRASVTQTYMDALNLEELARGQAEPLLLTSITPTQAALLVRFVGANAQRSVAFRIRNSKMPGHPAACVHASCELPAFRLTAVRGLWCWSREGTPLSRRRRARRTGGQVESLRREGATGGAERERMKRGTTG